MILKIESRTDAPKASECSTADNFERTERRALHRRQNAFAQCTQLASVVLPDSVRSIHDGAFEDCTCLETLVLPKSLVLLEDCFSGSQANLRQAITVASFLDAWGFVGFR
jgi:hypothetical protein